MTDIENAHAHLVNMRETLAKIDEFRHAYSEAIRVGTEHLENIENNMLLCAGTIGAA
jgi:hypothetical protein